MLFVVVFVLFGCDDFVLPKNNVVVKSIETYNWSGSYCLYGCTFVNKEHLHSSDETGSAFLDLCGKFQIGDTVHVEIIKSSKEIKLEK